MDAFEIPNSASSAILLHSVVTLKLLDVEVEGRDGEDSGGAEGGAPCVASLTLAPHPVVVDAVAVDANDVVEECLESALAASASLMWRVLAIFLVVDIGFEEVKSSSKHMLHVAVGILHSFLFGSLVTLTIFFDL